MADPTEQSVEQTDDKPQQDNETPESEDKDESTDTDESGDESGDSGSDDDSADDPSAEQQTTDEDESALDSDGGDTDTDSGDGEESDEETKEQEATDASLIFEMITSANEALGDSVVKPYRIATMEVTKDPIYNSMLAELNDKTPGGIKQGAAVTKSDEGVSEIDGIRPVEKASASSVSITGTNVATEGYAYDFQAQVDLVEVHRAQLRYVRSIKVFLEQVKAALADMDTSSIVHCTYKPTDKHHLMASNVPIKNGGALVQMFKQTINCVDFSSAYLHKFTLANIQASAAALSTAIRTGDVATSLKLIYQTAIAHNTLVAKTIEAKLVSASDNDTFPPTVSGEGVGHHAGADIVPMIALLDASSLAVAKRDSISSTNELFTSGVFIDVDAIAASADTEITLTTEQVKEVVELGLIAAKSVIVYERQAKELQNALKLLVIRQHELMGLIAKGSVVCSEQDAKNVSNLTMTYAYRLAGGRADFNNCALSAVAIAADVAANLRGARIKKEIQTLNFNGNDMRTQRFSRLKMALEQINEDQESTVPAGEQLAPTAEPVTDLMPDASYDVADDSPGPEAALADVEVSPEDQQAVVKDLVMQEQASELVNSVPALESLQNNLRELVKSGTTAQMRTALVESNKAHNRIRTRLNMGIVPNVGLESHGSTIVALEGLIESIGNTLRAAVGAIKKFFADFAARREEARLRARAQAGDIMARLELIDRKVSLLKEVKGLDFTNTAVLQNIGLWSGVPTVKDAIEKSQDFHDIYVDWMVRSHSVVDELVSAVKRSDHDGLRALLAEDIERFAKNVFPNEKDRHASPPTIGKDQYVRYAPVVPGNSALGVVMPVELYNPNYQGNRVEEVRLGDFSSGVRRDTITTVKCATAEDVQMLRDMADRWMQAFERGRGAFNNAAAMNRDSAVIADYVYGGLRSSEMQSRDAAYMVYDYCGSFLHHALTGFNIRAALRFTVFSAALTWVEQSIARAEEIIKSQPAVQTA